MPKRPDVQNALHSALHLGKVEHFGGRRSAWHIYENLV